MEREQNSIDYMAPGREVRPTIWRDAFMIGGAFLVVGVCWALSYGIHFIVGLKYIDGAAGKPMTPDDQATTKFANALPYIGGSIGAALIIWCAIKGTLDKRRYGRQQIDTK